MIDRRTLIGSTAAAIALAPAVRAAAPPTRTGALAVPPVDPLSGFMRLHSASSGTSLTTLEGVLHGAMPGETARPLVRFHSLVVIHVSEPLTGVFRTQQREATWFTALGDDTLLTAFANPYTQETVTPFGYVSPTNVYWFTPNGTYQRDLPPVREGARDDVWMHGGKTLWVSETRRNVFPSGIDEGLYPRAYNGPNRVSADVLTYQAAIADFARNTPWVPATVHMTTNGPWPLWLMMGRRAGGVIWTGHGEKYAAMSDIPAALRSQCDAVYPGFTANPDVFPERDFGTAATMTRLRAAGKL